uniref:Putative transaldolase n=1 Tax=viral metagenome TaxID=1070528 RepID=A0A6M3ITS6_9ZZZZ
MKIFLDTADLTEIKRWFPMIDGVTTNPLILEKDGGDVVEIAKFISPMPISIEACGNLIDDARYWSKALKNAVIKIPFLNPFGGHNLGIVYDLSEEGIEINCTVCFSLSQLILAEKAGARYVSLFAGRVEDEGGNFTHIIKDFSECNKCGTELIVGSMRTVGMVLDSIRAGADIVTIPPAILDKMVMHQNALMTSREMEDANNRLSK